MLQTIRILLTLASTHAYVLSLTDQSPEIWYTPEQYGNGTNGWNVSYSLTPWSSAPSVHTLGQGTSSHSINSYPSGAGGGGGIAFQFVGTGFVAYGRAASSVGVQILDQNQENLYPSGTINGEPGTVNGRPVLASASDLPYRFYEVVLDLPNNGGVFYGLDLELVTNSTTNTTVSFTSNDSLSNAFNWSNDWSTTLAWNSSGSVAYTNSINASVTFAVPINTSLMILYGDVDQSTGQIAINLNSSIYTSTTMRSNDTQINYDYLEPVTPWAASNQVVYHASLLPGYAYNVSLQLQRPSSNNPSEATVSLDRVVFIGNYTTSTSTPSTSTPMATPMASTSSLATQMSSIEVSSTHVGLIVGGVLGGVAVILISVWLCRRKRGRRVKPDLEKPFMVDRDPHPSASSVSETLVGSEKKVAPEPSTPTSTQTAAPLPARAAESPTARTELPSPVRTDDGLDPFDPGFHQKWEILYGSSARQPPPRRVTRPPTIEVDAGRVEGETLPPNYNPAWAPSP